MKDKKTGSNNTFHPVPVSSSGFNPKCKLPYGLTIESIQAAMEEFVDFLGFINSQLQKRSFSRFEDFLMPANFSSMVGEFMHVGIEKNC